MKIEDRKSCEYRFSSILINFYRLYQLSMIIVYIMISDTFAPRIKYRYTSNNKRSGHFPQFFAYRLTLTQKISPFHSLLLEMPLLDCRFVFSRENASPVLTVKGHS